MFMGMFIFPLIGLVAAGLLVAVCIMEIVRAVTVPSEISRATSCGGCGHEISTLGAGRCPECGGDLIRVGLATRRMVVNLRGSTLLAVMSWTILVGMATAVVGYGVVMAVMINSFSAGGGGMSQTSSGTIAPTPVSGTPRSAPTYSISYSMSSNMGAMGATTGSITMDLATGPQSARAVVDLSDLSYSIQDASGVEVSSGIVFNAAAAQAFMESGGLAVQGVAEMEAEADELAIQIRDASRQPYMFGQTAWGGTGAPSPLVVSQTTMAMAGNPFGGGPDMTGLIVMGVLLLVVLLVYIGGIVFIVKRRSKLLRRPSPEWLAPAAPMVAAPPTAPGGGMTDELKARLGERGGPAGQ